MINDQYVPPENIINPPAIYVTVEGVEKPTDIKPLPIEIKRLPVEKAKPSTEDLKEAATSIKDVFADGFQWHDIATLMKLSLKYIDDFFDLDGIDKKEAVLQIIDFVIDETDTPYLPDFITDPIFKALANEFVNIIMPDSIDKITPTNKMDSEITMQDIEEFVKEIKEEFEDGFQIQDIADITCKTLQFACGFINTTADDKKQTAKDIVEELIKSISIPFIPESFSDSILTALADGFIDISVDVLEEVF